MLMMKTRGIILLNFNITDNSYSDKVYHNLKQINDFTVFNEHNDYLYKKFHSTYSLTAASVDADKSEVELMPKFTGSFIIKCKNEYAYFTDISNEKLIRFRYDSYIRKNKRLTVLSTDNYKDFIPFGCGYTILHNVLTDEEMALALLSLDKNFDICCINSKQDISANIRDKGSFYPLNKIKEVNEYLDSCFPYIKEIATNSDGDIWMLPIYIDIPCFIYNPYVCKEYGIDISSFKNFNGLLTQLDNLNQNNTLKDSYYYNNRSLNKYFLYQYFSDFNSFNSNMFRDFAQTSKSKLNYTVTPNSGNIMLPINLSFNKIDNFLFMLIEDSSYQVNVANNETLRACALPDFTDVKANIATCCFLTVNPASKNLKEALQYISSLCKYLMSMNENIMTKDRTLYPATRLMDDLYNIYSNGNICFTYPDELYMEDFESFLKDEKDLESMISDSDRRLDTFLNE